MRSELELRVRRLDDESKSILKRGKEIAKQLGISYESARRYLKAKRAGFKSHIEYTERVVQELGFGSLREYRECQARQRINPETGEQFKSSGDYKDYLARQKGFRSLAEYAQYRKILGGDPDERNGIDAITELLPPSKLDKFPAPSNTNNGQYMKEEERLEIMRVLNAAINELNERRQKIIRARFFEGRKLRDIADELGCTTGRVRQQEFKALMELRESAKGKGLCDLWYVK